MRTFFSILLTMLFTLSLCSLILAQDKKEFEYTGVKACKPCHFTSKSGAQYKIWEDGPHAKAYATLGTPEAKKIAKEKGIEDPQKADACLKCHVTAFGVPDKLKSKRLTMEEGVGCEACHGPGSEYKGRKVMIDLYEGKLKAADYGLIKPVTEEVCVSCHNDENPTFKEFDFEEMAAKIAHPVPKE